MAELQDLSQAAPRYIDVPRFEVEDHQPEARQHLEDRQQWLLLEDRQHLAVDRPAYAMCAHGPAAAAEQQGRPPKPAARGTRFATF